MSLGGKAYHVIEGLKSSPDQGFRSDARYIVLVYYMLPLTYSAAKRKVEGNRDQLTPFSALLDPPDRLKPTAQLPKVQGAYSALVCYWPFPKHK
jgi:hypothetical protein